jgi:hypothetical protein
MRPLPLVVAVILALVGLVWIGQGTGVIAGSAMSGTGSWAVVGLLSLVLAIGILVRERRRAPRS